MLFTFKRDDEGRERIYIGDVCVAKFRSRLVWEWMLESPEEVTRAHICDAIERADEAGFWGDDWDMPRLNEITVDVPVADSTVLSVTTGKDES